LGTARQQHTKATAEAGGAAERVTSLRLRIAKLEGAIEGRPDAAALQELVDEVKEAHSVRDAATRQLQAAQTRERAARKRVNDAIAEIEKSRSAFTAQRDGVAALGPPPPGDGDLASDWRSLAVWAAEQAPQQEAAAGVAANAATEAAGALTAELEQLCTACQSVGVAAAPSVGIDGLREVTAEADTKAAAALDRLREALAEAATLSSEIDALEKEADVAAQLGQLLKANGFERWLITEALDALVDGASATLGRLSSGQYALTTNDQKDFLVVDHANADETRLAKTLSGGETFQASLALALALADQLGAIAADGASKLESIFLDEGFGTLDPDTLNVVADTIENLGQEDRVVGVITHVRELADRIPVRFVVTKGPHTSTVERVDA
jgi:exonuclease SbcC